jgi:hypothetical protein
MWAVIAEGNDINLDGGYNMEADILVKYITMIG